MHAISTMRYMIRYPSICDTQLRVLFNTAVYVKRHIVLLGSCGGIVEHRNWSVLMLCFFCESTLRDGSGLRMHMRIHTGEWLIKATSAKWHLSKQVALYFFVHMTAYIQASDPINVTIAKIRLVVIFNNRRRHLLIHTGHLPRECDICRKTFS